MALLVWPGTHCTCSKFWFGFCVNVIVLLDIILALRRVACMCCHQWNPKLESCSITSWMLYHLADNPSYQVKHVYMPLVQTPLQLSNCSNACLLTSLLSQLSSALPPNLGLSTDGIASHVLLALTETFGWHEVSWSVPEGDSSSLQSYPYCTHRDKGLISDHVNEVFVSQTWTAGLSMPYRKLFLEL